MGKVGKRRIVLTTTVATAIGSTLPSAAIGVVGSFTSESSSHSTSDDTMVVPRDSSSIAHTTLSTAFSCGSHWRKARGCSTLCPSGRDSACPNGEYCYAGIPCSISSTGGEEEATSKSEESGMNDVLKQQARMEQIEVNQLKQESRRHDRFVCGGSYVEAAESCAATPSSATTDSSSALPASNMAPQFCPTGSSSQCPTGMECYAAVSCPLDPPQVEEVSLVVDEEEVSVQPSDSVWTTEHSTAASNGTVEILEDSGSSSSSSIEDWTLFFGIESTLSRTVSALLSSRYGLN